MTNPVFDLPEFRVGPYALKVVAAPRSEFEDKRRVMEHDWNRGVLRIGDWLSTRRALECVTLSMVTAIHYRSGLNDKSDEESYTHSLATGLVEMAHNNSHFWGEFQQLLEDDYKPGAGFGRTAAGDAPSQALQLPSRIVMDHRTCKIEWLPLSKWNNPNVYGWYFLKTGPIKLRLDLVGTNLALVSLHEVLHFLHETLGLNDRTKEKEFKRTQAYMLLRFIQQNPGFWNWWLHLAAQRTDPMPQAA
jgi:hypothetical protein